MCKTNFFLCACVCVYLSVNLSLCLSVFLCLCLSVCVSLSVSLCLSICLSVGVSVVSVSLSVSHSFSFHPSNVTHSNDYLVKGICCMDKSEPPVGLPLILILLVSQWMLCTFLFFLPLLPSQEKVFNALSIDSMIVLYGLTFCICITRQSVILIKFCLIRVRISQSLHYLLMWRALT